MRIIIIAALFLFQLARHPLITTVETLGILEVFMLASNKRTILHKLLYCNHLIRDVHIILNHELSLVHLLLVEFLNLLNCSNFHFDPCSTLLFLNLYVLVQLFKSLLLLLRKQFLALVILLFRIFA